jgi:hypothetical protein
MIATRTADFYRENAFIGSNIDMIEACLGSLGDFFYLLYGYIRKIMSVHHDDWSESTGAEAVHCFKRDLLVRSCFPWFDSKLALKFKRDHFTSANMAGRSEADRDKMFPSGFQTERSIECRDSVEINQRTTHLLSNIPQGLFRKIAILGLDFFKKRDETRLISVEVILYDFLYVLRIHDGLSLKSRLGERSRFPFPIGIPRNAKLLPRVSDRHR